MDYKSILCNYFKRNSYELPSYTTKYYDSSNSSRYKSECRFKINKTKYVFHTKSRTQRTKKYGDNRTSFLACRRLGLLGDMYSVRFTPKSDTPELQSSDDETPDLSESDNETSESETPIEEVIPEKLEKIYIIDLENKPQNKNKNLCPDSIYIGFLSSKTNTKYPGWKICQSGNLIKEFADGSNRLLCVAQGRVADLADHYMSAFASLVISFIQKTYGRQKKVKIYVVSQDHAGQCTTSCFKQLLEWKNITNVKVKNVFQIR